MVRKFRCLQKVTQYIQIVELSKIREIVELDEGLKYYRSKFNKKIQEYENTASDVSKSEWLLEKFTDIEKLIVNIKAVGDKRRQLLNTEEARNVAAEQQKTAMKDLKPRVSPVRKLIEEHQEELKARQRSPIRTPKISRPSSVRWSEASAASSKADKMEAERLKAKMLREKEIEQKKIDNELKIQARQREIEEQQKKMQEEQRQMQAEIEREKREMEAELQKQLLDAEAEDAIRQIDINQARVNGSRA